MRKLSILMLGVAIGAGTVTLATQSRLLSTTAAVAAASDTYRQLNLFGDVFEKIRSDYVEKPDEAKLIETAINGMLSGLDPHSSYMDAEELPRHAGADPRRVRWPRHRGHDGGRRHQGRHPDRRHAGLAGRRMAGDIITHIDDEPVQGLTLNQAVEKMRGAVNSAVRLKIVPQGFDRARRAEADPRRDPDPVRALAQRDGCRLHPRHPVQRADLRKPQEVLRSDQQGHPGGQAEGLRARPPEQPRRSARPGDRRIRRVPRARRDRIDPRAQCRRDPALQRPCGAI